MLNVPLPCARDRVGRGQKDVLEAERRLLRAKSQNSPLAWHNLGTLYVAKHAGLERRWGDAHKCYDRAKELGFDCANPYPPC